jgi:hypothetical protein
MILDQATISRLKQLYFDYYDCETFVLPETRCGDTPISPTVHVLPAEHRNIRNVIEEHNVLEDVVDECVAAENDDMEYDDVPEEITHDFPAHHRRRKTLSAVSSIAFNEAKATREIYGSASVSLSAVDLDGDDGYFKMNPDDCCEVEDLL